MALINTLRNKAGKFVTFLVAAAIISFTLNDLLGSGSSFLLGENHVGEINGEKISNQEYQDQLQFQESMFRLYTNRQPSDADRFTINDAAWRWLIGKYAFAEQYDKVGIQVSEAELLDMLNGANIDPTVASFFSPNGTLDRNALNQVLSNPNAPDVYTQTFWSVIYPAIVPARERIKYENLIIKSTFTTTAEGMFSYHSQSDVAETEYLYIPYYSMSDTAVNSSITESMIKDYYNSHKNDFKIEDSKSLEYIALPIQASSQDTTDILDELADLKKEFISAADDSAFAYINTEESGIPYGRFHKGDIPFVLQAQLDSLVAGRTYGPYLEGDIYRLYKVNKIYNDTTYYSNVRHILFRKSSDSEASNDAAKAEAEEVLGMITSGSNFQIMARQYSDDTQTKNYGGDLGWINDLSTSDDDKEIVETIFAQTAKGVIPRVLESAAGYHIVEVMETKTNRMYAVASIERAVVPSNSTIDGIYRQADLFRSSSKDVKSFEENAAAQGFQVAAASDLKSMSQSVGGVLGNARSMVQWAFRDGKVGKVSEIYEVNDHYVVAVLTDEIAAGYRPLESKKVVKGTEIYPVKDLIKVELRKQLKADKIMAKLNGATGTLQEIADNYGEGAQVYTSSDLKLFSNNLPTVGDDPIAVGKIFSLKNGETSSPFKTDNGVFIAKMMNKTIAPEVADYSAFTLGVLTTLRNNIRDSRINDLIEKDADIKDLRYKVY